MTGAWTVDVPAHADGREGVGVDIDRIVGQTSKDLEALQKRALIEGIPYQTLISSILHKYIQGRRKEQNL